jgi:hypothetical protein
MILKKLKTGEKVEAFFYLTKILTKKKPKTYPQPLLKALKKTNLLLRKQKNMQLRQKSTSWQYRRSFSLQPAMLQQYTVSGKTFIFNLFF